MPLLYEHVCRSSLRQTHVMACLQATSQLAHNSNAAFHVLQLILKLQCTGKSLHLYDTSFFDTLQLFAKLPQTSLHTRLRVRASICPSKRSSYGTAKAAVICRNLYAVSVPVDCFLVELFANERCDNGYRLKFLCNLSI